MFDPKPGDKSQGFLTVCDIEIPMTVINGTKPGKTALLLSGIHGGEYVGIEAAIRLGAELSPDDVSGRIIILHPVNIPAFYSKTQYLVPYDEKNLNRVFPGKFDGTVSEKIAFAISDQLYTQCDFMVDMHGGDIHEDLIPFVVYAMSEDEAVTNAAKDLAEYCGIERICGAFAPGTTIGAAAEMNIPAILMELGKCGRWSEDEVETYTNNVKNLLRFTGVLDGSPNTYDVKHFGGTNTVTADTDGLWYPLVSPGQTVTKGEPAGFIRDAFGKTLAEYTCPADGTVLYVIRSLAINKLDPIFSIGKTE